MTIWVILLYNMFMDNIEGFLPATNPNFEHNLQKRQKLAVARESLKIKSQVVAELLSKGTYPVELDQELVDSIESSTRANVKQTCKLCHYYRAPANGATAEGCTREDDNECFPLMRI